MRWRPLGAVSPNGLTAARLELHWAAQLVSAPGTTLLAPAEDYSHTNLAWDAKLGALTGRPVGDLALRAALVFESFALAVLQGETLRASRRLPGLTLRQGRSWLCDQIDAGADTLRLPEHDMPEHPIEKGQPFTDSDSAARTELAAWFSNATMAVQQAVGNEGHASCVRCWPHHFDVASLVTLDPKQNGEDARSIGVGFSPGDGSYDQPYFYVNPWPYPDSSALPPLEHMRWHTEGWTGAVLTGERLVRKEASRQPEAIGRAFGEAIVACRTTLGA